MRQASVERNTKETQISAEVDLDGTGSYDVSTGIGFLDHMLDQLSRHSLIDLKVRAQGDLLQQLGLRFVAQVWPLCRWRVVILPGGHPQRCLLFAQEVWLLAVFGESCWLYLRGRGWRTANRCVQRV